MTRATVLLLACLPAAAHAMPAAAFWFGQSLLLHDRAPNGAAYELWLDHDGRYTLFIDRPAPAPAPDPTAIEGSYQATDTDAGTRLCLTPPAPTVPPIPFAAPACALLPAHPIDEAFPLSAAGRSYDAVLVQGR